MTYCIDFRKPAVLAIIGILILALLSGCAETTTSAPETNSPTPETQVNPTAGSQPTNEAPVTGTASEIVVYASDLPESALSELDFYDDSASPGGKYISLPNNGDELDAPPENDPNVTFPVQVQSDTAYRCWIHMKVGTPKGRSTANIVYVQFSDAVDQNGSAILQPRSGSYLTAQGPAEEGWTWAPCDQADSASESMVYFSTSGEVTVRLQAGAEGVGFDQFVLSAERFLNSPPSEPIVEK